MATWDLNDKDVVLELTRRLHLVAEASKLSPSATLVYRFILEVTIWRGLTYRQMPMPVFLYGLCDADTGEHIVAGLPLARSMIGRALNELVDSGMIRQHDEGDGGGPVFQVLVPVLRDKPEPQPVRRRRRPLQPPKPVGRFDVSLFAGRN